jgi:hypothetical protein
MTKHVLDRPASPAKTAVRRVIAIRRNMLPRNPTLILQRRHRGSPTLARARHFWRIARGELT